MSFSQLLVSVFLALNAINQYIYLYISYIYLFINKYIFICTRRAIGILDEQATGIARRMDLFETCKYSLFP